MTFRYGDIVQLEIKLASIFGAAQAPSYASLAAFLAAGWTMPWYQSGVLMATQPTVTSLTPDPSGDGTHYVLVTLPYGTLTMRVMPPATRKDYVAVNDWNLIVQYADVDSIAAAINSAAGTVVSGGTVTVASDQTMVEGDSFNALFTVPTSALKVFDNTNKLVYQFADLTDITAIAWTIAAQARYSSEGGQLPSIPVAFNFQAQITDKANRIVGIGWQTAPANAVVDDVLPSAPTVTVAGNIITGATGGTGGHIYGTGAVIIALTGGGGTGGALAATVVNGQVTGYTVSTAGTGYATPPTATLSILSDGNVTSRTFKVDVQMVPPVGSTYASAKLTVVSFNLIIVRQQTTTP